MARIDVNTVIMEGRLTRKPELRYTTSGKAVTSLSIANNQGDFNGEEQVNFVDVTVWGNQAEHAVNNLDKGRRILVEGVLKMEAFENREGQKVNKLVVLARRVSYLDYAQSNSGSGSMPPSGNYSNQGGSTGGSNNAGWNPPPQSGQPSANAHPDAPGGGIALNLSDDDIPF